MRFDLPFLFPFTFIIVNFIIDISMTYIMNNDCLVYKDSKQYVIIIVTIKMFQEQTLQQICIRMQ